MHILIVFDSVTAKLQFFSANLQNLRFWVNLPFSVRYFLHDLVWRNIQGILN